MDIILTLIYSDPFYYIGVAIACVAAFGFVYFLAGALPAMPHLILHDGHDEHMDHYRHRVYKGAGLMVEMFFVWEVIRLGADLITGRPVTNFGLVSFMVILYIIAVLGGLLQKKLTGKAPKGPGH